ncbi:MAG: sensor histidine kinase [Methermicoccaceae archaeon]
MRGSELSYIVCRVEDRAERLTQALACMGGSAAYALCASEDVVHTVRQRLKELDQPVDDIRWVSIAKGTPEEMKEVVELLSSEELFVVLDREALVLFTPPPELADAVCKGVVVWGMTTDPHKMLSIISRKMPAPAGRVLFEMDPEGNFLSVHDEGLEELDMTMGSHISDIVLDTPENWRALEERTTTLLSGRSPPPYLLEAKSTSGKPLWVEVKERGVFEDDVPVSTQGELVDVSTWVMFENELAEYEQRLNRIATRSRSIIYRRNLYTFSYDYINETVEDITGYTMEEHLKNPNLLYDIVYPQDAQSALRAEADSVIYRIVKKNGMLIWVKESHNYVYDSSDNLCAIEGVITDITDLMNTQFSLENELKEYVRMLERSEGIVVGMKKGRVVLLSEGAERCTGCTYEDAKDRQFLSLFVPEDVREEFREHLTEGGVWEMPLITSDGSRRHVLWSCTGKGEVEYLFGLDITHHVEMVSDYPSKLKTLQKEYSELNELNELRVSGMRRVVHDLKAPVITLKGNLELLSASLKDVKTAKRRLGVMDSSIGRLVKMVDALREAVQADADSLKPKRERVELDALLRDILDHLEDLAATEGIAMEDAVSEELWVVGDGEMLWSVFSNLVLNAINYTPEGGRVVVDASREHSRVHVKVEDTGVGMSKSVLERVFESFYTSAESGGMGLGLYVSKSVVEAHGGSIWAESTPDVGSTFHVLLPLAQDLE